MARPWWCALDHAQTGVVLVAPDGRLLVWSDDGALRGYDVGGPLSSATAPTPITFEDRVSHDLLAVAQDGAVVLIGGLAAGGPRAVARLDARALRDARITVADLDGDGASEAVVLSDVRDRGRRRRARRPSGGAPGATSIRVIRVRPLGLELRARFAASAAGRVRGHRPGAGAGRGERAPGGPRRPGRAGAGRVARRARAPRRRARAPRGGAEPGPAPAAGFTWSAPRI